MEGEDGDDADDPRSFSAQAAPGAAGDPRRRRRHEHRPGVRHLLRHRARWRARVIGVSGSARSRRARRPRRPASGRRPDLRRRRRAVRVLRRAQPDRRAARATPARPSPLDVVRADGTPATSPPRSGRAAAAQRRRSGRSAFGDLEQVYRGGYVGHDVGRVGRRSRRGEVVRWGGLIIGGPRRARRRASSRTRPRRRRPPGPVGIAVTLADIFSNVGPDPDPVRRRRSCRSTWAS